MNEYSVQERETANETFDLAQLAARRRFATSSDRCPYCDTKRGDEAGGLHLLYWQDDIQPGDLLWDGEWWMACRRCNWDDKQGKPYYTPEGAIVMPGIGWHPSTWVLLIPSKEAVDAVPNL